MNIKWEVPKEFENAAIKDLIEKCDLPSGATTFVRFCLDYGCYKIQVVPPGPFKSGPSFEVYVDRLTADVVQKIKERVAAAMVEADKLVKAHNL